MMNNPLFSIITVCYSGEEGLAKTIDSVRDQTFKDLEYIIIDAAHDSNLLNLIKRSGDIVTNYVSEKDEGVYNAMNKGAKLAKGKYLFFLNLGDTFASENVLEMVSKNINDFVMLYGNIRLVKDGKKGKIRKRELNKYSLMLGNKVSQQAVFVDREQFLKLGGLNEGYKIAADYDLLCKIFSYTDKIAFMDYVICNYDTGGISSNLKKSYDDTSRVILSRYGFLLYLLYYFKTRIKILISKFLKIFTNVSK